MAINGKKGKVSKVGEFFSTFSRERLPIKITLLYKYLINYFVTTSLNKAFLLKKKRQLCQIKAPPKETKFNKNKFPVYSYFHSEQFKGIETVPEVCKLSIT